MNEGLHAECLCTVAPQVFSSGKESLLLEIITQNSVAFRNPGNYHTAVSLIWVPDAQQVLQRAVTAS